MNAKFSALLALIYSFTFSMIAHASSEQSINSIKEVERQLRAKVGVSVYSVSNDDLWHYNGDYRFPLMVSAPKSAPVFQALTPTH